MGIISILGPIGSDADFFGGTSFASFQSEFNAISEPEVTIEIFSPGGSVLEGLAIYDLIRGSEKTVTTKVIGLAGSIASIIALAADRVQITENAEFFIHNPQIDVTGDAEDLAEKAQLIQKIENRLIDIYASSSNIPPATLNDLMKAETSFNASEALEAGFATEIIAPVKAVALLTNKFKKTMGKSITTRLADMAAFFDTAKAKSEEADKVLEETKEDQDKETIAETSSELPSTEEIAAEIATQLDSFQSVAAELTAKNEELTKALAERNADMDELKKLISGTIKPTSVNAMGVGHQGFEQPKAAQNTPFAYGGVYQNRLKEIKEKHANNYGYKAHK